MTASGAIRPRQFAPSRGTRPRPTLSAPRQGIPLPERQERTSRASSRPEVSRPRFVDRFSSIIRSPHKSIGRATPMQKTRSCRGRRIRNWEDHRGLPAAAMRGAGNVCLSCHSRCREATVLGLENFHRFQCRRFDVQQQRSIRDARERGVSECPASPFSIHHSALKASARSAVPFRPERKEQCPPTRFLRGTGGGRGWGLCSKTPSRSNPHHYPRAGSRLIRSLPPAYRGGDERAATRVSRTRMGSAGTA
jgi:hypothetical protein